MVLPPLALVVGLIWLGPLALGLLAFWYVPPVAVACRRAFVIWEIGTFACWVLTIVMVGGMIKGRGWLLGPCGVLAMAVTVGAGLAGLLYGSVALFCVNFALTVATSVGAIRAATVGSPRHRGFCWGFGVCALAGAAYTLMAPAPFTGTPISLVMWWVATEWGSGLSFDALTQPAPVSYQGTWLVFLTWFFAFTGGCLLARIKYRLDAV